MEELIKKMKVKAKEVFIKENREWNDGEVLGVVSNTSFVFDGKEYELELNCFWKRGHSYKYLIKYMGDYVCDGFVRM